MIGVRTTYFLLGMLVAFWIDGILERESYRQWVENLPVRIEKKGDE